MLYGESIYKKNIKHISKAIFVILVTVKGAGGIGIAQLSLSYLNPDNLNVNFQ